MSVENKPLLAKRDESALRVWEVESLRVTAFLTAPVPEQKWWTELLGAEAESKTSNRRVQLQQEEGSFQGKKLNLLVRANRVDWVLAPQDDQAPQAGTLLSLGTLPGPIDPFLDLMLRWLKLSPPVERLAIGAILLQPVADRRSGYREIAKYLPAVKLDAEGSSDFSYQINRRRRSTTGIPNLEINRLSKWSVAEFRFGALSVSPASVAFSEGEVIPALRLKLDVNTAPEFQGSLPENKLPNLLRELVDLTLEIAERGDVP